MSNDDRAQFSSHAVNQSLAMGQDRELFAKSVDLFLDADQYDYVYQWSWMGLPIIQFPADIMATQEVMWTSRPTIIIETGVARGGSVVMMAALQQLMGGGKVIGVDIDIRAHNREAIESHPMSPHIVLIEGPSTSVETIAAVRQQIGEKDRVMVVLDSDHSRAHVLDELRHYGPLVTKGCYLVAADTLIGHISEEQAPKKRSKIWFKGDEPLSAVNDYLTENDFFEVDPAINGKLIMSSSPGGYLKRVK